ncbi:MULTISPECIES: PTS fructose transporter subunit IIC [Pseudonocardia]|uniref:PTS system fructose-specific EIIBC component n=2 Tax=Pseudonocardia TaxID=1847 RepID=A0A1Y2MXZ2_PSEAH|nr:MULTISPECIES: fructose-specific PTS transporter subunit EIIC [Pseudonocardia]OSY39849.1 PTS system fructose-specific EIIBC component [Pseudonocardia autotrophica]TDN74445.1 PTS system D-fructose-specific IIB component (F1P-forming) (Frc family) /PTS system D-fructose-specific IIC component (F1P-forming) (Frc family) [Pseudonocardia autotrophica]BBG05212.1 PTS fructose transporter subunit IIBC [Pseudonocardia autotrophica]GEC25780.1 PTS fructose transporter subunit IIBC [Pseudonocardia saturn
MKLLAVTACPTGIAHTYMAAEALEVAAEEAGHEIVVETQGSAGSTPFTEAQIAEADAIILAADVEVRDKDRFAHLPTVTSPVKKAIGGAPALIEQAAARAADRTGGAAPAASPGTGAAQDMDVKQFGTGFGSRLRGWLMTGVSYVIPFVAAGGLLIALGFALGGYQITEAPDIVSIGDGNVSTLTFDPGSLTSWAALSFQIGGLAFGFLVPVLAGFIAYAMADRPALVPGFVGGMIAVQTGAGFLGGLVAGLLAGAVIMGLKLWQPPRALAGIMPVLVLPLIGTAVVGTVMFLVVGQPLAAATTGLTNWLNGLSGTNALLLGALLGLMMAFDMGGPVNKAAYAFAVAGLSTGSETALMIMAAVMAAGMVPPLALALATVVRKNLFTKPEQENGRAAWLLGASFITEGAIPFAAADPLRVIPSIMAGSAVTGSLSMAFGSTLRAPHGGIFVVPLIGNPFAYLLAIVAGTLVSAALVIGLKSARRTPGTEPAGTASTTPAAAPVTG